MPPSSVKETEVIETFNSGSTLSFLQDVKKRTIETSGARSSKERLIFILFLSFNLFRFRAFFIEGKWFAFRNGETPGNKPARKFTFHKHP
jgi:hypothetical protein